MYNGATVSQKVCLQRREKVVDVRDRSRLSLSLHPRVSPTLLQLHQTLLLPTQTVNTPTRSVNYVFLPCGSSNSWVASPSAASWDWGQHSAGHPLATSCSPAEQRRDCGHPGWPTRCQVEAAVTDRAHWYQLMLIFFLKELSVWLFYGDWVQRKLMFNLLLRWMIQLRWQHFKSQIT